MTTTAQLADFVQAVEYDDLPDEVGEALKKRVLDTVGIGIGAIGEEPVEAVLETVHEVDDGGPCTLWGGAGTASPPQAAMYNTTLTRYLDYMDSFLAPGETPHPSDCIASIVACAEAEEASGEELLAAVGVAYEVQAALAWHAPVRDRGFDHVTHTVIAQAAGCSHVLGLDYEEVRHAVGIAGTAHNALRVTRTEGINAWKGVAAANAARNAVYSCLLARNGMEGPTHLFEGRKGWKQVISGDFSCEYNTRCRAVQRTMTKQYVAETYAQSAVDAVIALAEEHDIDPGAVETIRLETFHGAKLIIGGGEGSRYEVETKAQADHSLPYMLAAALIDREMTNAQYEEDRIQRDDVQRLLQTVEVEEDEELTRRFEDSTNSENSLDQANAEGSPRNEMPARVTVTLEDGTTYEREQAAFDGHPSRPASWEMVEEKFRTMTADRYDTAWQDAVVETVQALDDRAAEDLTAHLSSA